MELLLTTPDSELESKATLQYHEDHRSLISLLEVVAILNPLEPRIGFVLFSMTVYVLSVIAYIS